MSRLAFAFALCASVAFAQEGAKIDNPEYASWKDRKVGSTAKYAGKMDMSHGEQKMTMETETTHKLLEVTPEKCKVETTTQMSGGGMKMPARPMTREVLAKIEAKDYTGAAMKGKFEKTGEGDEEVEAGGKKYACHWLSFKGEPEQQGPGAMKGPVTFKVWTSKDVPGGMVKFEMKADDGAFSMTQALVEFKTE